MARQILASGWWARFTFNGITACGNGAYSLIGGDELSDAERDALQQLCRQHLDAFREQRGEEVFAHRSRHRSPISGSVKYRVHRGARGRCECCGAHKHQRALEVAPIIPKNQGGSDAITNLQAHWRAAAGCCWRTHSKLCIADAYPVSEGHSLVIPRRQLVDGMGSGLQVTLHRVGGPVILVTDSPRPPPWPPPARCSPQPGPSTAG
ncbi:HNH endonuclease [Cyanobium gracile]|uniref:HNH endonuclease n=1 Tax=Cyanobium gracile UHCC 0281 TaxID=3110309 RepID=A0ABU5SUH8_9CYAN|nr:HNH endonuclease [Cyanobium gracile]MEA5442129.1 HNH endonuclease [Cyanobium gracile UHCC 0281]